MKRAAVYLRVSTLDQTTSNQERELRAVARRIGCKIIEVYKDHGITALMRSSICSPGLSGDTPTKG